MVAGFWKKCYRAKGKRSKASIKGISRRGTRPGKRAGRADLWHDKAKPKDMGVEKSQRSVKIVNGTHGGKNRRLVKDPLSVGKKQQEIPHQRLCPGGTGEQSPRESISCAVFVWGPAF